MDRPSTKVERLFSNSVFAIFLFTAGTKALSIAIGYESVARPDPAIYFINTDQLMLVVAGLEFVTAMLLRIAKSQLTRVAVIAWVSTVFLCYRVALYLVGYDGSCDCLGSNLSWVAVFDHVLAEITFNIADIELVMKCILGYQLIGSYGLLFWLWRERQTSAGL